MDILSFLLILAVLYCVLMFFDIIFKTCSHYPYIWFLRGTGLTIKLFYLKWCTTAFNRILVRWGNSHLRFFDLWFTLGLFATLILLPVSVILIIIAIAQILFDNNVDSDHSIVVEPVIPGVNLPLSELGYYTVTLIFCSIIHEIGHALAAVREDVHLISVGISVFFIVPVAYVNISNEKLLSLNAWRALKILCAGVWHNLVLSFVAFLLYLIVPYIFSMAFYINEGVRVSFVENYSPLLGPTGLHVGDVVIKVNDCPVNDETSWSDCLMLTRNYKPSFCVDTDVVHSLDESIPIRQLSNGAYDCCGPSKPDWLCFEYIDNNNGILELPPHMCLPARKIVETFSVFCNVNTHECPNNLHCIYPLLPNATTLLKLGRIHKQDVIYIGHSTDILYTVHVSPFIPKYYFKTTFVPDTLMKQLRYIILFSLGFALVNVIPCIYMDGQHIVNFIFQIILGDRVHSRQTINLISSLVTLLGTALLLFHCVYAIWSRFSK